MAAACAKTIRAVRNQCHLIDASTTMQRALLPCSIEVSCSNLQDHARLVLDSVADAIAERVAEGVDAVDQSSDSQLACSLDDASQDPSASSHCCARSRRSALPRQLPFSHCTPLTDSDSSVQGRLVLHCIAGDGGSNVGYAVAAALLRADRLQLQSSALSSSQPFSKSVTRILQARRPSAILPIPCCRPSWPATCHPHAKRTWQAYLDLHATRRRLMGVIWGPTSSAARPATPSCCCCGASTAWTEMTLKQMSCGSWPMPAGARPRCWRPRWRPARR
jgi:hypothetical protein